MDRWMLFSKMDHIQSWKTEIVRKKEKRKVIEEENWKPQNWTNCKFLHLLHQLRALNLFSLFSLLKVHSSIKPHSKIYFINIYIYKLMVLSCFILLPLYLTSDHVKEVVGGNLIVNFIIGLIETVFSFSI